MDTSKVRRQTVADVHVTGGESTAQTQIEVNFDEDLEAEVASVLKAVEGDLRELAANDSVKKALILIGERCSECGEMKP